MPVQHIYVPVLIWVLRTELGYRKVADLVQNVRTDLKGVLRVQRLEGWLFWVVCESEENFVDFKESTVSVPGLMGSLWKLIYASYKACVEPTLTEKYRISQQL